MVTEADEKLGRVLVKVNKVQTWSWLLNHSFHPFCGPQGPNKDIQGTTKVDNRGGASLHRAGGVCGGGRSCWKKLDKPRLPL